MVVNDLPLVSALMLADCPGRTACAIQSVNSFLAQTWPHKELLVLNMAGISFPKAAQITEVRMRPDALSSPAMVLQDMVQGEWWFNWPDDCWFSPDYIQKHMAFADRTKVNVTTGAYGVLLPSTEHFRLTMQDACLFSCFRDGRRMVCLDGPEYSAMLTNRRPVDAFAAKFYKGETSYA